MIVALCVLAKSTSVAHLVWI